MTPAGPRVKVQRLQQDGGWQQLGVGHARVIKADLPSVQVTTSPDDAQILNHPLHTTCPYYTQASGVEIRLDGHLGVPLPGSIMLSFLCADDAHLLLQQLSRVGMKVYAEDSSRGSHSNALKARRHRRQDDDELGFDLPAFKRGKTASPPPDSMKGVKPLADAAAYDADRYRIDMRNPASAAGLLQIGNSVPPRCLEAIERVLESNADSPERCDVITTYLVRVDFPEKLLTLYAQLDDLSDSAGLQSVCRILQTFFVTSQYHSRDLLSSLLSEDNVYDTICALENIPSVTASSGYTTTQPRRSYEAVLHEATLKNPLGLGEEVQARMRRIFHISFLKDSVLSLDADDMTEEFLGLQGAHLRAEIVTYLMQEEELERAASRAATVLGEYSAPATPGDVQRERLKDLANIARFMLEILGSFGTAVPPDDRELYAVRIIESKLLQHLQAAVREATSTELTWGPDLKCLSQSCAEMWKHVIAINTQMVRKYVVSEPAVLRQMLSCVASPGDAGVRAQWQEVALLLLETRVQREKFSFIASASALCTDPEPVFFSYLYNDPMQSPLNVLLQPINCMSTSVASLQSSGGGGQSRALRRLQQETGVLYTASAVVSSCIQGHGSHVVEWVVLQKIPEKVTTIVKGALAGGEAGRGLHKSILLEVCMSCIWLLRAMLECPSGMLHELLAELDPFSSILKLYSAHRGLLASSCLALINQIWTLNRQPIVNVVATQNRELLASMPGTQVGEHFLRRHEINCQQADAPDAPETPVCELSAETPLEIPQRYASVL